MRAAEAGDDAEDVPKSIDEARASPQWPQWQAAIQAELKTLEDMKTWTLEDLPADRMPVGAKWVFALKKDQQGNIVRYKARLVAKGFSQRPGLDYSETFSPIVRPESIRTLLAIAAIQNLEMRQLDVKGAYLHGDLKEEVYMVQPPGFEDETGRVCRLRKTLYGLKQSGREWNRKLHELLTSNGFERLQVDHGVYKRHVGDQYIFLTVWVDDLLVFSTSPTLIAATQAALAREVEVTDMGEPQKIIGIEMISANRIWKPMGKRHVRSGGPYDAP